MYAQTAVAIMESEFNDSFSEFYGVQLGYQLYKQLKRQKNQLAERGYTIHSGKCTVFISRENAKHGLLITTDQCKFVYAKAELFGMELLFSKLLANGNFGPEYFSVIRVPVYTNLNDSSISNEYYYLLQSKMNIISGMILDIAHTPIDEIISSLIREYFTTHMELRPTIRYILRMIQETKKFWQENCPDMTLSFCDDVADFNFLLDDNGYLLPFDIIEFTLWIP